MLTKPTTHYEALEITPDASPHEVREAYLRLKNAYNKDSVALYTLISTDEREEILERIEKAYQVLSDAERRKDYDRCHEQLQSNPFSLGTTASRASESARAEQDTPFSGASASVVSIDRVPPMDSGSTSEEILVPPRTDEDSPEVKEEIARKREEAFAAAAAAAAGAGAGGLSGFRLTTGSSANASTHAAPNPTIASGGSHSSGYSRPQKASGSADREIDALITGENEWKGETIRKIREARIISIEELASSTKISKTYLGALENEDFAKLPAAVFTRGFLIQLCRILRLPQEKVLNAYMARYQAARGDQQK